MSSTPATIGGTAISTEAPANGSDKQLYCYGSRADVNVTRDPETGTVTQVSLDVAPWVGGKSAGLTLERVTEGEQTGLLRLTSKATGEELFLQPTPSSVSDTQGDLAALINFVEAAREAGF